MSPWQPAGLITLTTDYGLQDAYVGIVKGSILRRFAPARIVDLTHAVPAFAPQLAGFWLARSSGHFPAGTVHVAVVDPGVGTSRRIVLLHARLQSEAHCWLAPDNGLLVPVLAQVSDASLYDCDLTRFPTPGATFHGRDLFAPLAAQLAAGETMPAQLGTPLPLAALSGFAPARSSQRHGSIIASDHFGNLFTDLEGPPEQERARLQLQIGGRRFDLLRTYGDVPPGGYLALVNSFGVVELARREGSAAQGLGFGPGERAALVPKS